MHVVKSDFIGNVCSTKMSCFQILSLVQQRIFLFAYLYLLKPQTSYPLHLFSYKYSHFNVSGGEKGGTFRK